MALTHVPACPPHCRGHLWRQYFECGWAPMGQKKRSSDTWSCPGKGVMYGPFPNVTSPNEPYRILVKIDVDCKHPKGMMASMQLRGPDRETITLQSETHSRHKLYQRHLAIAPTQQIENGFIIGGTKAPFFNSARDLKSKASQSASDTKARVKAAMPSGEGNATFKAAVDCATTMALLLATNDKIKGVSTPQPAIPPLSKDHPHVPRGEEGWLNFFPSLPLTVMLTTKRAIKILRQAQRQAHGISMPFTFFVDITGNLVEDQKGTGCKDEGSRVYNMEVVIGAPFRGRQELNFLQATGQGAGGAGGKSNDAPPFTFFEVVTIDTHSGNLQRAWHQFIAAEQSAFGSQAMTKPDRVVADCGPGLADCVLQVYNRENLKQFRDRWENKLDTFPLAEAIQAMRDDNHPMVLNWCNTHVIRSFSDHQKKNGDAHEIERRQYWVTLERAMYDAIKAAVSWQQAKELRAAFLQMTSSCDLHIVLEGIALEGSMNSKRIVSLSVEGSTLGFNTETKKVVFNNRVRIQSELLANQDLVTFDTFQCDSESGQGGQLIPDWSQCKVPNPFFSNYLHSHLKDTVLLNMVLWLPLLQPPGVYDNNQTVEVVNCTLKRREGLPEKQKMDQYVYQRYMSFADAEDRVEHEARAQSNQNAGSKLKGALAEDPELKEELTETWHRKGYKDLEEWQIEICNRVNRAFDIRELEELKKLESAKVKLKTRDVAFSGNDVVEEARALDSNSDKAESLKSAATTLSKIKNKTFTAGKSSGFWSFFDNWARHVISRKEQEARDIAEEQERAVAEAQRIGKHKQALKRAGVQSDNAILNEKRNRTKKRRGGDDA